MKTFSKSSIVIIILFGLLIGRGKSQFEVGYQDLCPEPDPNINCPNPEVLVNECLVDGDCDDGEFCCSDGCALKCTKPKKITKGSESKLCAVPVDLGFIIDVSGSIGKKNFDKIKAFIEKIVDSFDIQEEGTHVGAIYYSDNASLAFDFNKFKDGRLFQENVVKELRKIEVTDGQTRIDLGLELASKKLFTVEAGMRIHKPKIALVLTDGKQTRGELAPDAKDLHEASGPLKDAGVQVYSLGIGKDYDIGELLDIASDDASVFRSSDFDELVSVVDILIEQTCKGCTRAVDVHFTVDSSVNVGKENFEFMKDLIKAVGYKFIISETQTHMSGSVFGDEGILIFDKSQTTTQDEFLKKVDTLPYLEHTNGNMDKALKMISKEVFNFDGYARQNAPKVVVMLTSSSCKSCEQRVEDVVKPLKAEGIHVVVIPIGFNVDFEEITGLASHPIEEYTLPRGTYEELLNGIFIQKVSEMICSGKPGICAEPPVKGECPQIINECSVDMRCPLDQKCCIKNCVASCSMPLAACITPLEIAFAFETVRSGEADFENIKKFAVNLLDHFKVESSKSHVSVSTFSDSVGYLSTFIDDFDMASIKDTIRNLKTDKGNRNNLGDFLEIANKEIFSVRGGVRQSTPRVLVLFTNGDLTEDQAVKAQQEALKIKADGKDVNIVVVNVGSSTKTMDVLNEIASENKFFEFAGSSELASTAIEATISEKICSTKVRRTKCQRRIRTSCAVKDNLCNSDFDCPGHQECFSDGCRLRCQTCEYRCKDKVDLLFVMDTSSRFGREAFENSKQNVKKMLEWFTISPNNTNVGVITYSDTANIAMPLPSSGYSGSPQNLIDVHGRLDSIPYSGGSSSNLDNALQLAAERVFPDNSPKLRRDSKKAVVIVTDSIDNSPTRLELASWPLRRQRVRVEGGEASNIRILAVTVGKKINLDMLKHVVSPPLEENVFFAADFNDMYNGIRQLAEDSCKYAAAITPPPVIYVDGDPGPPGPPGLKGAAGLDGRNGTDGLMGEKGQRGDPGVKGSKGELGLPGPPGGGLAIDQKGPDPMASAVGIVNITGVPGGGRIVYDLRDGPAGPIGPAGRVGPKGVVGDTGSIGIKGRNGPPGRGGIYGPPGIKGDPGLNGNPGLPGDPGQQGLAGRKGPQGAPGPQGPQGPFGYKGEGGVQGVAGDVGDPGKNGTKGYAGDKGDRGDIGIMGFPGADGSIGPIGAPGKRGLQGLEGQPGPIGPIGLGGNVGLPGPAGKTGLKGQTGSTGARGPKGRIGDIGTTGPIGTKGTPGEPGRDGKLGLPGNEGPEGLSGQPGEPGPIGDTGEIGPQGEFGPDGIIGLKGDPGRDGMRGLPGYKGYAGDTGLLGSKGLAGEPGKQGTAGVTGARGKLGNVGARGFQGLIGEPGRNGQPGLKGNQGPNGETGIDGLKGAKGYRGLTGDIGLTGMVGSVGEPGQPGMIGRSGRPGINGRNGDDGVPGPQGADGIPGVIGILGMPGDPGDLGDRGITGAVGFNGTRGDPGRRGQNGEVGPQGPRGLRGDIGQRGPQGLIGFQGPPGPRGDAGLDGFDGPEGQKGAEGKLGNTGVAGEQGYPGNAGTMGPIGKSGNVGQKGNTGGNGELGDSGNPGLIGFIGDPGRKGSPGLSGRRGVDGASGKPGLRGPKGYSGLEGNEGEKGPNGLPGPLGLTGPRGDSGADGKPGQNGSPGVPGKIGESGKPGMPGLDGPPGLRGSIGSAGTRGIKGPPGDRGESGDPGSTGPAGEIGQVGFAGAIGFSGEIGEIGLAGMLGPQGMIGAEGLIGPSGLPGPPGIIGSAGKDGIKGPNGDQGDFGKIGKAGGPGSRGKDGSPGIPGVPGPQGQQGFIGSVGTQGPVGEEGTRGAPGLQGSKGKSGPKGLQGLNGSPGTNGLRGLQGSRGEPGLSGQAGNDGKPGKPGSNGTDGSPGDNGQKGLSGVIGDSGEFGAVGALGEKGTKGPDGINGAKGPRGRNGDSGAPGKRGISGAMGKTGPRGQSGDDGKDGLKGLKGKMGRFGIPGPAGDPGLKGDTGPEGRFGYTGPQGRTGNPGTDGGIGIPGMKGETGVPGETGYKGPPGMSGDHGTPGTAGLPGPPGPPGPPGDISSFLSGNYMDFLSAGGFSKGPRYYRRKYKRSLNQDSNSIQEIFKTNYDVFKEFDSIWNKAVNDLLMKKTLGSSENPAVTCADLFESNPIIKSGDYWIDPNEGSPDDALLVFCNNVNNETCIYPKSPSFVKDSWFNGIGGYIWIYSNPLITDEEYISYSANMVQLNMIRLMSEKVRQNITYHCKNSLTDLQIKTDDDKIMNINNLSKINAAIQNNCVVKDGKWRQAVFEMKSEHLKQFPLQDVAFKNADNSNEEFRIDIGPVCFS